jgi:predicted outer membrane repeat protein
MNLPGEADMIRLRVVLVLFFGVFAVSLLPAALVDAGDPAQHSNSPTGTTRPYPGAPPCNTTLQACISGSAAGDIVQISANTYVTTSLSITRAVSLIGGGANPSAVKLRPTSGRMIQYSSVPITASFVISNLSVENGNVGGSSGGGIRVQSGAAPLFFNIVVSNNIGTGGGGIRIIPAVPATLINVTVFSNTSAADGGGIHASGSITLIDSRIELNSAAGSGGGVFVSGELRLFNTLTQRNSAVAGGGGAFAPDATIEGGSFERNVVSTTIGLGGGLLVSDSVSVSGTQFLNNSAAFGGGAFVSGTLSLTDGALFRGNFAARGGGGADVKLQLRAVDVLFLTNTAGVVPAEQASGGGVLVASRMDLTNTQFLSNTAEGSGGGAAADTLTAANSLFSGNKAGLSGGGASAPSLIVTGTQFTGNVASVAGTGGTGGGAEAVFFQATNSQFNINSAIDGGGAAAVTLIAINTQFIANQASDAGGGAAANSVGSTVSTVGITGSVFIDNFAPRGGGLWYFANVGGSQSRIVNSLFAHNFAHSNVSGAAAELQLENPGALQILHTTIAGAAQNTNPAIVVLNGTVSITDSNIVSHSVGIIQAGGSVREDYNLFFGNTNDSVGAISTGGHSVSNDPAFVNPAGDNYHLALNSPAIDAGVDAGVTADFDGDPRPLGAGFDIGFDELNVRKIFLPIVVR